MEQFFIAQDGMLSEAAAIQQAAWFEKQSGRASALDFEAHFMLMRGFEALKTATPLERRTGISKARYGVLRILYQAEGCRLVMSDIVQSLHVSPTNITKLVDALERDNYVRRTTTSRDKRKVWVELLPKGKQMVDEMLPAVVDHVHFLWSGLTPDEKRVLIHLLSKLRLGILTGGTNGRFGDVGFGGEAVGATV